MQKPPSTSKNSKFSTMNSTSGDEKSVDMADFVGVESYVDLKSDLKLEPYKWFSCCGGGEGLMGLRRREKKKVKIEREYPPPLPWLAKTENVPSSQMPWVMKRYHTSDGRLIIKEEKVERFEYFEAHRTDGRLMLNLVPLNDDVFDSDFDDEGDGIETDGCDQVKIDRAAEENESALVSNGGGAPVIGGGGSGGVKCSSLCTFGVAVPATRPVHT